jgi:hypothetical protein
MAMAENARSQPVCVVDGGWRNMSRLKHLCQAQEAKQEPP